MNRASQFTEDYFLRGPETGLSNYVDYSWREETVPACQKIMHYLGAHIFDSLLEIGCARGYYVKALRLLCYRAYGHDISEWAVANCDPEVKSFVSTEYPKRAFDWCLAKDVAEHMDPKELLLLLCKLNDQISKGMLFIVPLSKVRGGDYIRKEDNVDSTHVIRWPLDDWISFFEEAAPGFNVNASYDIHGIKPASTLDRHSCGFLTLIRP